MRARAILASGLLLLLSAAPADPTTGAAVESPSPETHQRTAATAPRTGGRSACEFEGSEPEAAGLLRGSDVVAIGSTGSRQVADDNNGRGPFDVRTSFFVDEVLRGPSGLEGRRIQVRVSLVKDEAWLSPGKRHLLYLRAFRDGIGHPDLFRADHMVVLGLQGRIDIEAGRIFRKCADFARGRAKPGIGRGQGMSLDDYEVVVRRAAAAVERD